MSNQNTQDDINWAAIAEECGYTQKEIAHLKRLQAFRLPDDPRELMALIHEGVVEERRRRDEATDASGFASTLRKDRR